MIATWDDFNISYFVPLFWMLVYQRNWWLCFRSTITAGNFTTRNSFLLVLAQPTHMRGEEHWFARLVAQPFRFDLCLSVAMDDSHGIAAWLEVVCCVVFWTFFRKSGKGQVATNLHSCRSLLVIGFEGTVHPLRSSPFLQVASGS